MREIKFRAWDTKYNEWTSCGLGYGKENKIGIMEIKAAADHEIVVMQFTGLLDRNGKEIYEGDIVEWDDNSNGKWRRRCVLSWEKSHYALKGYFYDINNPSKKTPIDFKFGSFIYECDGSLEIIGNIYENPELLNSSQLKPTQ